MASSVCVAAMSPTKRCAAAARTPRQPPAAGAPHDTAPVHCEYTSTTQTQWAPKLLQAQPPHPCSNPSTPSSSRRGAPGAERGGSKLLLHVDDFAVVASHEAVDDTAQARVHAAAAVRVRHGLVPLPLVQRHGAVGAHHIKRHPRAAVLPGRLVGPLHQLGPHPPPPRLVQRADPLHVALPRLHVVLHPVGHDAVPRVVPHLQLAPSQAPPLLVPHHPAVRHLGRWALGGVGLLVVSLRVLLRLPERPARLLRKRLGADARDRVNVGGPHDVHLPRGDRPPTGPPLIRTNHYRHFCTASSPPLAALRWSVG
mmetsp:Transcript_568/g.1481  ORF Transcript_568/g.1481 Transcript_568/m.1481 type:complete len:311 (+) Transcript_568:55-987(+)